ncbi:MAG: cyclase family protein [Vicinamibacterales bacterium]
MKPHVLKTALLSALLVGIVGTATPGQQRSRTPEQQRAAEQKRAWMTEQSNWGRWGANDELGTLNLITTAKRQQALALATTGTVVSLARKVLVMPPGSAVDAQGQPVMLDMDAMRVRRDGIVPPGQTVAPFAGGGNIDQQTIAFHGSAYTHLDGLCHIAYEGKLYNGYPHSETVDPERGCSKLGIQLLKDGIVTRGVLIDLPRLRGVSPVPSTTLVRVEDIEEWERIARVKIAAGDAVFLRTGRQESERGGGPFANYDPSLVAFFKTRGGRTHLSGVPSRGSPIVHYRPRRIFDGQHGSWPGRRGGCQAEPLGVPAGRGADRHSWRDRLDCESARDVLSNV